MKKYLVLACLSLFILNGCGEGGAESANKGQSAAKGQQQGGGQTQQQPPKNVGIITVKPQQISMTNELPGRVRAFMTAEIRPQVSGIIQSRLFKEGSFVEKGQQLYQIDPARYEADYQRAKANLQTAQAELENAESLQSRYQRLIDANAVSEQEYDNASASVKQAQAAVSLAEAEVKTAKINLDYTKVYSPITGYIGPSSVTEGALVTAQQEMELATVRQLDPVYVDLSQSAAEAQQLQERLLSSRMGGEDESQFEVTILLANTDSNYPHKGSLDATDLAVDENTGSIRLRSVFPNPEGLLLPGMFVRAIIDEVGAQKSIIVPQKSVTIEQGGTKSVWVVGPNNAAKKQEVRTGPSYKNNWIILNGLQSGDKVIVEGAMMLQEGAKVSPNPIEGEENALPDTPQAPANTISERSPAPDQTLETSETEKSQSE